MNWLRRMRKECIFSVDTRHWESLKPYGFGDFSFCRQRKRAAGTHSAARFVESRSQKRHCVAQFFAFTAGEDHAIGLLLEDAAVIVEGSAAVPGFQTNVGG